MAARSDVTAARARKRAAHPVRKLREDFGLSQAAAARLMDVSLRTLAGWEAAPPARVLPRAVVGARRLLAALSEIMQSGHVAVWLEEPNPDLGGLKPLEAVERGEVDRLWALIYRVGSGDAN